MTKNGTRDAARRSASREPCEPPCSLLGVLFEQQAWDAAGHWAEGRRRGPSLEQASKRSRRARPKVEPSVGCDEWVASIRPRWSDTQQGGSISEHRCSAPGTRFGIAQRLAVLPADRRHSPPGATVRPAPGRWADQVSAFLAARRCAGLWPRGRWRSRRASRRHAGEECCSPGRCLGPGPFPCRARGSAPSSRYTRRASSAARRIIIYRASDGGTFGTSPRPCRSTMRAPATCWPLGVAGPHEPAASDDATCS